MNKQGLRLLELNKIIDQLANFAGSDMARDKIKKIVPLQNEREVREALTETTEAVSVIVFKGSIPIGQIDDISGLLSMARKGRTLTMRDLLSIRRSMAAAREVRNYLTNDVPELRMISQMANLLETIPRLESDIDRCILSEDEMADNASPELKSIRRDIRSKNDAIKSRLSKYASSGAKYMQDAIVTVRNGRYVIPVKREYLSLVPGMIHDQSQSGATVFVEPQSVVNLNNELRALHLDEDREIQRILANFTARVAEHYHALLNNQELLVQLDVINAKGRLAVEMDANEPRISRDGSLRIISGRHPLIAKDKVVPINVELGRNFRTLLITGPNTGGKTVTLKTIGLFVLMTECGLHIPAGSGSEIPLFKDVYADIGDEQSIEQSLSTFSAHMKRINRIVAEADDTSLVLLDELCAGTDPAEGAALGIAVLDRLKKNGACIAATTHYPELKKYALETEGVENASMEFNVETLSPTYRLRIGLPGKSNAFEIAARLGADDELLNKARELLDESELSFDNAVSAVESERKAAEKELERARKAREKAEAEVKKADDELEEVRQLRDKALNEARKQAEDIVRKAKDEADSIIEDLKKNPGGRDSGERTRVISDTRRRFRELDKTNRPVHTKRKKRPEGATLTPDDIEEGLHVKVISIGQNGVVEGFDYDHDQVVVRVGPLKMTVKAEELMSVENEPAGNKERQRRSYNNIRSSKAKNIKLELNVIGENLDDALMDVGKYLDDAYLAGVQRVTIVHGRGTGVLKNGIRNALKRNKHVKSFKAAPYNGGGEGATIVELKE